jgi:hypothetical protein
MTLDPKDPDFDEDAEHPCPYCNKMVTNARIRALKGELRCIPCTAQNKVYGQMISDMSKGCGASIIFTKEPPERDFRR